MIKSFQSLLNKFGLDLLRYPNNLLNRRMNLVKLHGIDTLFDVGSNDGDYAKTMRKIGFKGRICSFEPLSATYKLLKSNAQNDNNWQTYNYALGDFDGELEINVSQNTYSSSVLDMADEHVSAAPVSAYVKKEPIEVSTLDSFVKKEGLELSKSKTLLKIDVQGFEEQVLKGAENSLKDISGIQLEMSFTELYQGVMLFQEMRELLESKGFTLCLIEPGFFNKTTGKLLQADGTFYRI